MVVRGADLESDVITFTHDQLVLDLFEVESLRGRGHCAVCAVQDAQAPGVPPGRSAQRAESDDHNLAGHEQHQTHAYDAVYTSHLPSPHRIRKRMKQHGIADHSYWRVSVMVSVTDARAEFGRLFRAKMESSRINSERAWSGHTRLRAGAGSRRCCRPQSTHTLYLHPDGASTFTLMTAPPREPARFPPRHVTGYALHILAEFRLAVWHGSNAAASNLRQPGWRCRLATSTYTM